MDFDLADFDSADTAEMAVANPVTGEATGWTIVFAGPGHPQSIALANRATKERLREERAKDQAAANGRKYKAPERTPDEVRADGIASVADRIVGWSTVKIGGEDMPYSRENAIKLLGDPRRGWLFQQAIQFLTDDASFTKRSATGSAPTPSASSA